jgi:hypothetical protein
MTQPNSNPDNSNNPDPDDDSNVGTGANNNDDNANANNDDKKPDNDGLKKALQAERRARQQAERALKQKELEALPELEQLRTKAADLEKENAKLARENLQYKVGYKAKLPEHLWKKLDGETEEEMAADAAEMAKHFKTDDIKKDDGRKPPNDGRKNGKTPSTGTDVNALLRAAAGITPR